jgi:hypothetical protein
MFDDSSYSTHAFCDNARRITAVFRDDVSPEMDRSAGDGHRHVFALQPGVLVEAGHYAAADRIVSASRLIRPGGDYGAKKIGAADNSDQCPARPTGRRLMPCSSISAAIRERGVSSSTTTGLRLITSATLQALLLT